MYQRYHNGIIEIICGCMFAGKTQELIRRLSVLKYTNQKIIAFKPKIDDRYHATKIVSHFGSETEAFLIDKAADILTYLPNKYDIIAIDEVQFLDDEIVSIVTNLADNGKRIIISGLDQDFRGEPFGPIPKLLSLAEFVTKLPAICTTPNCGDSATRTQRLIENKPAYYEDPIILVGRQDSYTSRCRKHHEVPRRSET